MNTYIKIGIGIFLAFIIAVLGYFLFPKSHILMSVAPSSMTLKIDNGKPRTITLGQKVFVIAGTHTYTFSRAGFADQTVKLTSKNNETKEILLALVPQTDAARAILENDTDASHAIQERVESAKEAAVSDALTKNYPILKDLPIVLHSIEIDSCQSAKHPDDPTKIALCVYSNNVADAQELVGPVLQQKGYNAANYEIIYEPVSDDSSDD